LNADLNYTNCIFEKNGVGQAAQISYGSMTATNCQFIENFCSVTWSNNINLTECEFTGNSNNIIGCPGTVQNCSFINNDFAFTEAAGLQISNCLFEGNNVAIDENGSSTISNSIFTNNTIAVKLGENSFLTNNTITNNGTGVQVRGANPSSAQIMDNLLCNNVNYNLENLTDKNFQVNTNCFCSSDSTIIENGIYDGYDDITRGLVNYAIYDDSCSSILSYVTKVVLNEPAGLSEQSTTWNVWQMNNELHVDVEHDTQLKLFSTSGSIFLEQSILPGENTLKLDVPVGIYILADQHGNRYTFYIGN
jgi:hypothetical protein